MALPDVPSPAAAGEGEGEGTHTLGMNGLRIDLRLLATIAGVKLVVLLVIIVAYQLLPFWSENFDVNVPDPAWIDSGLARAYSTWDAQHYLYLSENGYQPGHMENAFFPLFPLLIRLATYVFQNSLVAALVVANLCSIAGFYLLFKLVEEQFGHDRAWDTVLLYLAFPTAFFFSLPYSESLFLLLIASFFLLLFRGRQGWAAAPAALLPLARPEGALVILPFAVYYLVQRFPNSRFPIPNSQVPIPKSQFPIPNQHLAPRWLLAPFAGIAAYLLFMRAATGNAFEMFDAMHQYVSNHSLTYLLHPAELIRHWAEWPLAIHGFTNSVIDRAFFVGFLLLVVPMAKRLHPALTVYALAVGLLNVLSGTFMSYTRYVLLAFPIFITAALLLRAPRSIGWRIPILFLSTMIQGVFLVLHSLNYWIA